MRLLTCSSVIIPLAAFALASPPACARTPADSGVGAGSGPTTAPALLAQAPASASGPLGGGGAVELEAVPAPATPRASSRRVYACVGGGGPVTFSDRPCGPSASVRDLPVIAPSVEREVVRSASVPGRVVPPERARDTRTVAPARGGDRQQERAQRQSDGEADARVASSGAAKELRCDRLREAVQALDQHMRAGYSAREAGRLWARWREAKERLRQAGC